MDIASSIPFPGKRGFAPGFGFYEAPTSKRPKHNHPNGTTAMFKQRPACTPTFPKETSQDNGIFGVKRSVDAIFSQAKRFKRDPQTPVQGEKDLDGDLAMVTDDEEELAAEEAKNLVLQRKDILEHILGFMGSLCLQRYRAVSKLWKQCCELALGGLQLSKPNSLQSNSWHWKEFPRLVFDAKFRVNNPLDFFSGVWGDACSDIDQQPPNIQIEISGLSWKGPLMSLNLSNAISNRLVSLITNSLFPNFTDGSFHDLKIVVERGRVFLKLNQNWLPGTIDVREVAKLLGSCSWKGLLPTTAPSSGAAKEDVQMLPESMEE